MPLRNLVGIKTVAVGGFNGLMTVDVALSRGVLLRSADGRTRDLASVHGPTGASRKRRQLELLCDTLDATSTGPGWYLDSPVSNSGKLASFMREQLASRQLELQVKLVKNADRTIIASGAVAATSDSALLDACPAWLDLAGGVSRERVPQAWLLELHGAPELSSPAWHET